MTARSITDGLAFPECPRWRDGEVWFVDTPYLKVATLDGRVRTHAELPARLVLGLQLLPDGGAVVGDAVGRRFHHVDAAGRVELYADLSEHFPYPTNEAVLAHDGSLYVGSMGFDMLGGGSPGPSHLARVDPGGAVTAVGEEVLFPNGMLAVDGGRTVVVAESFAARISAVDLDDDGLPGPRRVVADLAGTGADHPDGIAEDGEGGYWYADPFHAALVQVGPDGAVRGRLAAPLPHPTACVRADDVLVVTATSALAGPGLRFSGAGALFAVPLSDVRPA